jgi:hypothetical protein
VTKWPPVPYACRVSDISVLIKLSATIVGLNIN